jgi:4-amino-4-deoxy-L-arabinose transferase-like glycosyltransferase
VSDQAGAPTASVDDTSVDGAEVDAADQAEDGTVDRRSQALRVAFLVAVIAIVGLGAIVRALPINSGLPYTTYVDEGHYLKPAAHMVAGSTWQVGRYEHPYQHPTLLYDLTAAGAELARLGGVHDVVGQARTTTRSSVYDVVEPDALILSGRVVDILLASWTVLLTILLAWKLRGRTAALAAGILCALTPALVSRSPIVIVDTPATFFVTLTLLLLAWSRTSPRRQAQLLVLAGIASGLAFTSKYPSGAVFLAVIAYVWRDHGLERPRRIRLLGLSALAGAVAALVTMPGLLLAPIQVGTDVISEAKVYVHKSSPTNYAQSLVNSHEVGWLLAGLGLVGVYLLWRRAENREFTIAWLCFAVPFVLYLAPQNYQPFRNLLPLLPFLAIGAATTLVEAGRFLGGRAHVPRGARQAGVVAVAVLLGGSMFFMGVKPSIAAESNIVDSRTQAVEWLQAHARPGQRILVADELGILPAELDRIPGTVVVRSATDHLSPADLAGYDHVVSGTFEPAATGWADAERAQPAVTFGSKPSALDPSEHYGNDERILIFDTPGQRQK